MVGRGDEKLTMHACIMIIGGEVTYKFIHPAPHYVNGWDRLRVMQCVVYAQWK